MASSAARHDSRVTVYLLIAKILGPIALLLGLWWWHTAAVDSSFKAGQSEERAKWVERDKIAVAVGNETTALLKRGAAANEGKLNAKLADLTTRNAASAVESRSLRDRLTSIAATPPSRPASSPACRSYETEYRSCAGLLGEGVELAGQGSSLVGELAAKLTAMQEWAGLVQSAR